MSKILVQFARGKKESYKIYTPEEKERKIYFAEDTNEIIVNDVVYGINLKDEDLDILSSVEVLGPGKLKFNKTNGKSITVTSAPLATQENDGLLSKEDKKFIDEIPDTYATKEELKDSASKVYRYKGSVNFEDLPTEGMVEGDTYNILNSFELDGVKYAEGTNVAWDGESWDPLGGVPGYSKEEADETFVAWKEDNKGRKLIVLPKKGLLIGTNNSGTQYNLVSLGIYDDNIEQVEIGSAAQHLCLNSSDRPTLDLPGGKKENIAYLSDVQSVGNIDLSEYPEGVTLSYIPELSQEDIDELGLPTKVNGEEYSESNPYVLGNSYIVANYEDTKYDLYSSEKVIPNTVNTALTEIRNEYINMLSWEIAD